jgi:hypothetical protein
MPNSFHPVFSDGNYLASSRLLLRRMPLKTTQTKMTIRINPMKIQSAVLNPNITGSS